MKHEFTIPCSQGPGDCLCIKLAESSPANVTYFFNIIPSSTPGSSKWQLPFRFPHQIPHAFSFSTVRATGPVHLISFGLIIEKKYLVRSALYEWWEVLFMNGEKCSSWIVRSALHEWWEVLLVHGEKYSSWMVRSVLHEWWEVFFTNGEKCSSRMVRSALHEAPHDKVTSKLLLLPSP